MPKRTVLLFLSLLVLTGCTGRKVPAVSPDTETHTQPNQDTPASRQDDTISSNGSINVSQEPQGDSEENTETTENPEQTLNKILNELHELDELMDGIQ